MRHELIVWSALLTLLLARTSFAQEPKETAPSPAAIVASLRQSRVVQDAVSLHLEDELPTQTWVLAEVRPDAKSFGARIEGGYVDDVGKFIVRPGERERTVVTELGSIKVLATLTGSPTTLASYKWEYELKLTAPSEDPQEELCPLFRAGRGGVAIFRVNTEEKGRGLFRPAYLLSDEWLPFVQPAVEYVQTHKEVFAPHLVHQQKDRLQQLTLDPNPLLAVAATRTLGEAHELDIVFLQGLLAQAKGSEQSVLVYLLMQQLPRTEPLDFGGNPASQPNVSDVVNKAIAGEMPIKNLGSYIDDARDANTLRDVTVGLAALLDAPHNSIFTRLRVEGLLKHVLMRQKEIGTHTEADAYLDALPILETIRKNLATK